MSWTFCWPYCWPSSVVPSRAIPPARVRAAPGICPLTTCLAALPPRAWPTAPGKSVSARPAPAPYRFDALNASAALMFLNASGSSCSRPYISPVICRWFSPNAPAWLRPLMAVPSARRRGTAPTTLPTAVPPAASASGSWVEAKPCPTWVPAQLSASPTPLMFSTLSTSGAYMAWRCCSASACCCSASASAVRPIMRSVAWSARLAFRSVPMRPAL